MIRKALSIIITFDPTEQSTATEAFFQKQALPGRLIPVPREITAGCDLSWKSPPDAKDLLCKFFEEGGIL
ncbi:MAG: DUF3343 domain-containing protein [Blautia sp.]|nr:DUF3343 domain-containing protein [Blautia sp.]